MPSRDDLKPDRPEGPAVDNLVAECLDETARYTEELVRSSCEEHPEQAPDIWGQFLALREAGLLGAMGPVSPEAAQATSAKVERKAVGPYRILKELGRGGQATVYLAEDGRLQRVVALKVLKGLGPITRTMMRRFRREAEVASRLEHPGICGVYDAGVSEGAPYIAMRYVPGTSLAELIGRAKKHGPSRARSLHIDLPSAESSGTGKSGARDPGKEPSSTTTRISSRTEVNRVLQVIEKAARALHAAHEAGIVHRDIKPGNIMATPTGDPAILDFGLAGGEESGTAGITHTGEMLGTPAYMSPEQLMAHRIPIDRRTDVYSLAVTLYECLTLRRPFKAPTREAMYEAIQYKAPEDPRKRNRDVSRDLQVVLEMALEKDRDQRYQTALDFADDLKRVRKREPVAARRVRWPGRLLRWARRRPARAALAAVILIGLPVLAGLMGFLIANRPTILEQERRKFLATVDRHLEEGFSDLAVGSREKAQAAFEAALALEPDTGEAVGGKALALLWQKRYQDCLYYLEEHRAMTERLPVLRRIEVNALEGLGKKERATELEKLIPEPASSLGFFLTGCRLLKDCTTQNDRRVFDQAADCFTKAILTAPRARALFHFHLARAIGHLTDEAACRRIARALRRMWDDSARACRWAGAALQDVDPEEAVSTYRKAIALAPEDAFFHALLASALTKSGHLNEAIAMLEKAASLQPDFYPALMAQFHYNIGFKFVLQERWKEAIPPLRKAISLKPDHAEAHDQLGVALRGLGRYDEAIAAHEKAIALQPEIPCTYSHLGALFCDVESRRNLPEAIRLFKKAIELAPEGAVYHFNLGNAYGRNREVEKSIAAYRKVVAIAPDSDMAHSRLGQAYLGSGKLESAIACYRKTLELRPDDAVAHLNLGIALSRKGELDSAIAEYKKARELNPGEYRVHYNLGMAFSYKGQLDAAITAYEKARELRPDAPQIHTNLGSVHVRRGSYDEAITVLEEAIRLAPNLIHAHANLGAALSSKGELEAAVAAYEKAMELNPEDARLQYGLGNVHKKAGRQNEAVAAFRKAVKMKPDFAEAHCNLGFALQEKGEYEKALHFMVRGHALGQKRRNWTYPTAEWVEECRQLVAAAPRLEAVLAGTTQPRDTAGSIALAKIAGHRKRHGAAAGLYRHAFDLDKGRSGLPRYDAACATALAGCGMGEDAANFDAATRVAWRRQALEWLREELAAKEAKFRNGSLPRRGLMEALYDWRLSSALAGLRDAEGLAALPPAERQACREFWQAVDRLVESAK